MKKQEKCIRCGKTFWSDAVKNKITKEIQTLDNICKGCKSLIRQGQMKRRKTVRIIPAEFEKQIRNRELYIAEMERRQKEKREA